MARATRIVLDLTLATSKTLRPALATSWQYIKTEAVPPMTTGFFHGPIGNNLEKMLSNITDKLINGLQQSIDQMDAEEKRKIREKEEALQAVQEKAKEIAQKAQATKTEVAQKETKVEDKTSVKADKKLEPTAKKDDKKGAPVKNNML